MRFETFRGNDLRRVFDDAKAALGIDVLIVKSEVARIGAQTHVEVVAARPEDVQLLKKRLTPSAPRHKGDKGSQRPLVIALVGPTGAGKTTTAAKLALNPEAFGAKKVGLLTVDTYKVGALEQMQMFADIGNLHLEVVYDDREVPGALKRLERCDAIIIDTPGRSPRDEGSHGRWQSLVWRMSPDEIHLVVPTSMRLDLVGGLRQQFRRCAPTHLLISKTDEAPEDGGLAALCARVDLPTRWLADGQLIPDDLRTARPRILAALGISESQFDTVAA